MSDLQPGDVLLFSDGTIPRKSSYDNWPGWFKHTSIVAEVTSKYIITFDSGHAYTHYGEPRTKRPLSGKPYEWCNDWIAFRYDFVANLSRPTGWKKISGDWYYYKNGVAVTGWHELEWANKTKKNWFYFNSNGVMLTGLHRLKWSGGEDVFFFDKNGAMQTGGATVNVKFDKSGKLIGGM